MAFAWGHSVTVNVTGLRDINNDTGMNGGGEKESFVKNVPTVQ